MEKDDSTTIPLDSLSPMSILDAIAESLIDLVRPAAVAQLQAYDPSNQNLIAIHMPNLNDAGSGYLSLHSGVNLCRITVSDNPALRNRRCLRRWPVSIFVSSGSIEVTRLESRRIPADVLNDPGFSWIRSLLDSDRSKLPWRRGSLDILPVVVERLNAGISAFERLFRFATGCNGASPDVSQTLGALHILRQMVKVLSPGVRKAGGQRIWKRKRCSVESFVSEVGGDVPCEYRESKRANIEGGSMGRS